MHNRHDGEDIGPLGRKLILLSSHVGSPSFMTKLFQDAMAICRYFHKLDLFLTMTANPKWPEIIHSLLPGQTATDHPDIVSWVSQTSFGHISINSPSILTVSMATESP